MAGDPVTYFMMVSRHVLTCLAVLGCLLFGHAVQALPPLGPQESPDQAQAATKPAEVATADSLSAAKPADSEGAKSDETKAKPKAEPLKEVLFGSQPYTVLVSVGFDGPAYQTEESRQKSLEKIQRSVQRIYGRLWRVTIRASDWMVPGNAAHLERLSAEQLLERFSEAEFQKVFLLAVSGTGSRHDVACREFDTRVHELTPVLHETLRDSRSVFNTCGRLIRDSFRPVLLFVRKFSDEDSHTRVEMQAQGGSILPPDPSAIQVLPGDVLRPFRREMERRDKTKLKLLRPFPLTYMRVMSVDTEVTRGLAETVFLSHLHPDSILGKGRRTQRLALRQRPTAEKSVVRLVLTSRPDKPLISHRLALAYQLGYKDEEDGEQTELVSDRNGEVTISVRENHPTFWIRVLSGTSLLARVPYAPGLIPFDTVKLPDDSVRLGVEGEIQLLSDELIDAIAQREVLIARANKKAEEGDPLAVTELLEQYSKIAGKDYFLEKSQSIQTNAETEAAAKRVGVGRLQDLCKGFNGSIETFFTDEKREARLGQIREIKATAERNKK